MTDKSIEFEYRNWKGEISIRKVEPKSVRFGKTEWHPHEQWLMRAFDFEKNDYREFAMNDILRFIQKEK